MSTDTEPSSKTHHNKRRPYFADGKTIRCHCANGDIRWEASCRSEHGAKSLAARRNNEYESLLGPTEEQAAAMRAKKRIEKAAVLLATQLDRALVILDALAEQHPASLAPYASDRSAIHHALHEAGKR